MADEEELIDEERVLDDDDRPFEAALSAAGQENYLGERSVVEALVRKAIDDLTDKLQTTDDPKEQARVMELLAQRNGLVLLGKSPLFAPQRRWNEAGGIDVFLAKWMGSSETDPDKVMEHVFIILFDQILEVAAYAGTEGVLPEQWQFQIDGIIHRFVSLCMGIDLPTQAIMEATSST